MLRSTGSSHALVMPISFITSPATSPVSDENERPLARSSMEIAPLADAGAAAAASPSGAAAAVGSSAAYRRTRVCRCIVRSAGVGSRSACAAASAARPAQTRMVVFTERGGRLLWGGRERCGLARRCMLMFLACGGLFLGPPYVVGVVVGGSAGRLAPLAGGLEGSAAKAEVEMDTCRSRTTSFDFPVVAHCPSGLDCARGPTIESVAPGAGPAFRQPGCPKMPTRKRARVCVAGGPV